MRRRQAVGKVLVGLEDPVLEQCCRFRARVGVGTIWSSSLCTTRTGMVIFCRSSVKSVWGERDAVPLLNRAIQGTGATPGSSSRSSPRPPPGSTPDTDFNSNYPCPSSYSIGGQVFKNFESQGYGSISLGRALEVSCDTVYYGLAHKEWAKDGGNKRRRTRRTGSTRPPTSSGSARRPASTSPTRSRGRVPDRQWKQDFYDANKASWCKQGKKNGTYVEKIAYEGCIEGNKMRAGDSVNYSIGQGDTLVTPIQMATIYAAITPYNGGTLYDPTVGKAIVSGRRQGRPGDRAPRPTASCPSRETRATR